MPLFVHLDENKSSATKTTQYCNWSNNKTTYFQTNSTVLGSRYKHQVLFVLKGYLEHVVRDLTVKSYHLHHQIYSTQFVRVDLSNDALDLVKAWSQVSVGIPALLDELT